MVGLRRGGAGCGSGAGEGDAGVERGQRDRDRVCAEVFADNPAVAVTGEDAVDDAHPRLEGGVVVAYHRLDAATDQIQVPDTISG
ncbi:hypothetical protein [Micromonospora sp. NPDC005324]|uniref:hypothetical protein n=1 Tax=Micromonospora sp. NPDC005324 TaxID=3157033 RepID=UPI0033A67F54